MGFIIQGIGSSVPQHSVTQFEAANFLTQGSEDEKQAHLLQRLFRKTGIQKRHIAWRSNSLKIPNNLGGTRDRMCYFENAAPALSIAAASNAIKQSGIPISQISHLITASCTGFFAPGIDIALIKALELSTSVSRTNVGFMGCHGAFNGLKVAAGLCGDGESALLVCTELCSLHVQASQLEQHAVANSLFADGAAAVVGTQCQSNDLALTSSISKIVPDSEELMSWKVTDTGFVMTLSPHVSEVIANELHNLISPWLSTHALRIEDIGGWAIHPGGPKILEVIAETLGLSEEQMSASRKIFTEYGNMSSPTVLFILEELLRQRISPPFVMLGFGPGLAIEAILFTK